MTYIVAGQREEKDARHRGISTTIFSTGRPSGNKILPGDHNFFSPHCSGVAVFPYYAKDPCHSGIGDSCWKTREFPHTYDGIF
jgi:hypothetical protein